MSSLRCYAGGAHIADSVPIHVEENGWPTNPPTRSYERQVQALETQVQAFNDFRGTYNVSDYRWFNLRDGDDSDPSLGQHYGLMRDDYSEKPAFAVVGKLFGELGTKAGGATAGVRSEVRCLRRAGNARAGGIGLARLGLRRADILRRLGLPASQGPSAMRYCVEGGGKLLLAFDTAGKLRLAASTSFSTHIRRVRTGSSLVRVKHVFPHARWIGKRLLRTTARSRVVLGSCSCGSVSFVAITTARSAGKIRYYAKKAGVPRAG
jgi:hypothetical protein